MFNIYNNYYNLVLYNKMNYSSSPRLNPMQGQNSYISPRLNPMQSQNSYISPRLNPIQCQTSYIDLINKKYYIDSSDESSITLSDKDSTILSASNDSLSSFEDYRDFSKLESLDEKEKINKGFISSICCSCIRR